MILFIDDEKLPEWFNLNPNKILIANSFDDAYNLYLGYNANERILYLDYDIGGDKNGLQLLEQLYMWKKPDKVYCISINKIGVEKIKRFCLDNEILFEDIGRKMMFEKFSMIYGQSG